MKFVLVLVGCCLAVASAKVSRPSLPVPKGLLDRYLAASGPVEIESRIINGDEAAARAAPYLVSLSVSSLAYAHYCAGTIIGREWVLTAAHCLDELHNLTGSLNGLPVYAGFQNRNDLSDAQVRTIDFSFNHKEFTGEEGSDDIALVHVTPPFTFNGLVKQISLPYPNEKFTGSNSTSYGWGLNDPEATMYVKELLVASGEVYDAATCKGLLPEDAPLGAHQICAAITACYGDGGSPLVFENEEGDADLVGITSWGYLPCGYNKRPTVYTAVAKYVQWIAEVQWAYYILH